MNLLDKDGNPIGNAIVVDDETAAKAQNESVRLNAELARTRPILHADEMCSLISPRARLEEAFPSINAYFFSIDGVLSGAKITGAMFAGECMLVFERNRDKAQELANAGLRATIELMIKEFDSRGSRELSILKQGLDTDVSGRRSHGERSTASYVQGKKMEAIIKSVFSGKPFSF